MGVRRNAELEGYGKALGEIGAIAGFWTEKSHALTLSLPEPLAENRLQEGHDGSWNASEEGGDAGDHTRW